MSGFTEVLIVNLEQMLRQMWGQIQVKLALVALKSAVAAAKIKCDSFQGHVHPIYLDLP